jgi:quercetin dioxygenase-like cupin family protein
MNMAYKNKTIYNDITRNSIKFLQTGSNTFGRLLEMEATYSAHSKEPPSHYHPYQSEEFTILSGELSVRINGQMNILTEGQKLYISSNTVHSMWNNTETRTVVNWKVKPALDTEDFFETLYGLANDGKTNEEGRPAFLQTIITARKFANVFRLSRPPYFIQQTLFSILSPVAHLFGFRPVYKKYIEFTTDND